ncbi:peptidase inhibitor family I36 protein [Microbacterium paraoxydans]|uniref:peptidase inhibitor family I36 protein n=1 Tax=Microbacterium paraoxydans TaxID=199592 RepID=UPI003D72EDEF
MTRSTTTRRAGMGRRVAALVFSAVAATSAMLMVAPAASAAPSDYCGRGKACLWDDASYNTNGNYAALHWFEYFSNPMDGYVYAGTGIGVKDTADSWYNNGRTSTACFYDRAGYQGASWCIGPASPSGQGDGNIENNSGLVYGVTWDPASAKFI